MSFPIFYINLASRPDRKEFLEAQLSAAGLAFERVDAIGPGSGKHPGAISSSDMDRYCNPENIRWVSCAELGCTLSHRKIWRAVVDRNLPMAQVLEDDMVLSSSLARALEALSKTVTPPDIVKLETRLMKVLLGQQTAQVSNGICLHRLHGFHVGTGAYVVSNDGARKLLQLGRYHDIPVDDFLFNPNAPVFGRISVRQMVPAMAVPLGARQVDLGRSDIGDEYARRHRESRHEREFMGPIERFVRRISRDLKRHAKERMARAFLTARDHTVAFAGEIDATMPTVIAPKSV